MEEDNRQLQDGSNAMITTGVRIDLRSGPAESAETAATPEQVVADLTLPLDEPLPPLPSIKSPELKLIGRWVTLTGETTLDDGSGTREMHYKGLVALVHKEIVTLMHVHRYSEDDFQAMGLAAAADEEEENSGASARVPQPASASATASAPTTSGDPHGSSSAVAADAAVQRATGATQTTLHDTPRAPSTAGNGAANAAASTDDTDDDIDDANDAEHNGGDILFQPTMTLASVTGAAEHDDDDTQIVAASSREGEHGASHLAVGNGSAHGEREAPENVLDLLGGAAEAQHHHQNRIGTSTAATDVAIIDMNAEDAAVASAQAPEHHRNRPDGIVRHDTTIGPMPFVTFMRKRIHNVEFAPDPPASFFSLFTDPAKSFIDHEYLRMFTRRFLVHSCYGNNRKKMSLRRFIETRGACRVEDDELLARVCREELVRLMHISKEMQRTATRRSRSVLRRYRAPPGLFRATGILYITEIPRQTFMLGIVIAMTVFITALYVCLSYSFTRYNLMLIYVSDSVPYVCGMTVVGIAAAGLGVMHSMRMRLPLSGMLMVIVGRFVLSCAALVTAILAIISFAQGLSFNRVNRHLELYSQSRLLLQYYNAKQCTGFHSPCVEPHENDSLCYWVTEGSVPAYDRGCRRLIMQEVERDLIPPLCFALVAALMIIVDHYINFKLFFIARAITRTAMTQAST